ncbi:MAG: hypothetical protein GY743_23480 [Planctomycetaceae bacterium]|nr:hypothetical protein [Planctomycetaceae bacterium]
MTIRNSDQAKAAIQHDAATRAAAYIEREIPSTMAALVFWVNDAKMGVAEIMAEIETAYDITEERVQHKIRLVVENLVRERDK